MARAEAARPDAAIKDEVWDRLHTHGYDSLHHALAAASGFWSRRQADLVEPFVERFFEGLPGLFAEWEPEAARGYFNTFFPHYRIEESTRDLIVGLLERPDLGPILKRMLVEQDDVLAQVAGVPGLCRPGARSGPNRNPMPIAVERRRRAGLMSRPTTTLHRFAWQAGSLAVGRGAALLSLLLAARELELDRYGRFVVLLALLEAAMIPWKPTVQQGAAAVLGKGGGQQGWAIATLRWWLIGRRGAGPCSPGGSTASRVPGWCWRHRQPAPLMFLHVPGLLLEGRQRRIATRHDVGPVHPAGRHGGADRHRLADAAHRPGWRSAIGSVVGAAGLVGAQRSAGRVRWAGCCPEVGTEGLRWVEQHVPILVVALVLGLGEAGGLDLLFKLCRASPRCWPVSAS